MSREKYQALSKFLCYVLRHKPGDIHLVMDHQGFVNVGQLIKNVNEYTLYEINEDILQEIVDTDSKGRYEYTGEEIRCVQGHSIPWVDPKPTIKEPPTYLFHGTTMEAFALIKKDGEIKKMKRHAVHMQSDISKAAQSAERWNTSDPVVLVIDARAMYNDGYEFGVTKNDVWLTDHVPVKYICWYIVNEGDDTMKHFSSCTGMCVTCASDGHCLAGIGDDDYAVADKAELIRRLENDKLSNRYKDEIKKVLKKEYDYDYDNETKATTRISKPEYYLKIAEAVSLRGTCLRRKFGAIIVKDDRIVSTGYVGAPRGRINCCDRGTCFRIEHNIPSGEAYHKCRSTHAEMNAVIQASPEEMKDATLYLVGIENDGSYTNADCCTICKRIIINSGIKNVIARQADGSYTDTPIQSWIDDDDTLDIDHKGY